MDLYLLFGDQVPRLEWDPCLHEMGVYLKGRHDPVVRLLRGECVRGDASRIRVVCGKSGVPIVFDSPLRTVVKSTTVDGEAVFDDVRKEVSYEVRVGYSSLSVCGIVFGDEPLEVVLTYDII